MAAQQPVDLQELAQRLRAADHLGPEAQQAIADLVDAGLLAAARHRFEAAVTRAELEAPMATGIARRLIETLANLGI
jgi:hypothetical protein